MSDPFLTPEDVAEIIAILDGSGYRHLDIGTRRFRLTVRRDDATGDEAPAWTQELRTPGIKGATDRPVAPD